MPKDNLIFLLNKKESYNYHGSKLDVGASSVTSTYDIQSFERKKFSRIQNNIFYHA